jgi:pimeloyl-ACP methyl ester carboxylesterase
VLFQHGGDQSKTEVFAVAGPLAEAGFAFVAIDLPFHGDRRGSGTGGSFAMVDFDKAVATRDNLRQAAADHLAVAAGLETLSAAVAATLGVVDPLDEGRVFFMGLSMGAIAGSMLFASEPAVRGAALFVGGADYPEILASGFFSLFVMDLLELPFEEHAALMALVETLLNGADPLAYARRVEDRRVSPRPVLLMEAVGDVVIPMPAGDALGRAFGAGLALPSDHPVAGLLDTPLPVVDTFAWSPGGGASTRLLVQHPMTELAASSRHPALIRQDYAQQMVAHCLRTFLDNGSCEVIDTGFVAH